MSFDAKAILWKYELTSNTLLMGYFEPIWEHEQNASPKTNQPNRSVENPDKPAASELLPKGSPGSSESDVL